MGVVLLIPIIMIGLGFWCRYAAPPVPGCIGYRTYQSMKSRKAWEFAHHWGSKCWVTGGFILVITMVGANFFIVDPQRLNEIASLLSTLGILICIGVIELKLWTMREVL